jgi:hypothetical protein
MIRVSEIRCRESLHLNHVLAPSSDETLANVRNINGFARDLDLRVILEIELCLLIVAVGHSHVAFPLTIIALHDFLELLKPLHGVSKSLTAFQR